MALLGKVLPLTVQNQHKPVEEMTDDELESYIAAIDRYLSRHGVDTTSRRAAIRAERAAALTL